MAFTASSSSWTTRSSDVAIHSTVLARLARIGRSTANKSGDGRLLAGEVIGPGRSRNASGGEAVRSASSTVRDTPAPR